MVNTKKQMQRQMYVNSTISKMKKTVSQLNKNKDVYIQKAKEAKERGDTASYKLAKSGLGATMAQLKRAQEMLINIEITNDQRQMMEQNAVFLETIGKIAKSISKINRSSNFGQIQKDIQKALNSVEQTQANMDNFLSNTDQAFESLAESSGEAVSDSDLDKIIAGEISAQSAMSDAEIQKLIDSVRSIKEQGDKRNV